MTHSFLTLVLEGQHVVSVTSIPGPTEHEAVYLLSQWECFEKDRGLLPLLEIQNCCGRDKCKANGDCVKVMRE
jgi:hypothetical protein